MEAEVGFRREMTANYDLRRGRSLSAPPSISTHILINSDTHIPDAEADEIQEEALALLKKEWNALLRELRSSASSDMDTVDEAESVPDMEMGRGTSNRPDSPFGTMSSSTKSDNDDDDLFFGAKHPAFAVTFGKENVKPVSDAKGKGKMVPPDFGVPGAYKDTDAYRRVLPAFLKPIPHAYSGAPSLMSADAGSSVLELEWEFPCYGELPEEDCDLATPWSFTQRIELWLDDLIHCLGDQTTIHKLPPIIALEPDWRNMDWEDLDEPCPDNIVPAPVIERDYQLHPSPGPSTVTATEKEDDWQFYVPEEPFPHQATMTRLPFCYLNDSDHASNHTARSHRTGSSIISDSRVQRCAGYEAQVWANFAAAEERREKQRERIKILEGRGRIAGENLSGARTSWTLRSAGPWPSVYIAPLKAYADFLDDEDLDHAEYMELQERFERAFDNAYRHGGTSSWPERYYDHDAAHARWLTGDHRMWDEPAPPPEAYEFSFSDSDSEDEEEERQHRMAVAVAQARSEGTYAGMEAYREAQVPETWGGGSDASGGWLSFWASPPRKKDPYVHDFVDDEGWPLEDREEIKALEKAYKRAYDTAFRVASVDFDGLVKGMRVIPSFAQLMQGSG